MTREVFGREFRYRVALALVKELRASGVISDAEYALVKEQLIQRFHPIIESLYPKN